MTDEQHLQQAKVALLREKRALLQLEKLRREERAREQAELLALEAERTAYRREQEHNAELQRKLVRMAMLDPFRWADGGLRSLSDAE